ncbi:MAG: hypothetical protein J6C85_00040 [Alphaproteobacteria bacterium]|nr:hypothetical protein [Alphaproteobacteria bacterium]
MKISANDRIMLSSIGLVTYLLSFLFDGGTEFILLLITTALMAVTFGFSIRNKTCRLNSRIWYAALFCMVLSSLCGNLGYSLPAGLLGVLAFALFMVLIFKAMYFLHTVCHKNCEDELDKEN